MEDSQEINIKRICCTCLSKNRKLFQLCRVNDGVNILYLLLSSDSEAYREGFFKDKASLFICWECKAVMRKFYDFRRRACIAQKRLTEVAERRFDLKLENESLSSLSTCFTMPYQTIVSPNVQQSDNFIDCGITDSKGEIDMDDIPLAILQDRYTTYILEDKIDEHSLDEVNHSEDCDMENKEISNKSVGVTNRPLKKIKLKSVANLSEKYFNSTQMSEEEMFHYRKMLRLKTSFVEATMKCEPCIEPFKSHIALEIHIENCHKEKPNHMECDICHIYVPIMSIVEHRVNHYLKYSCKQCDYVCQSQLDVMRHLKDIHFVKGPRTPRKKIQKNTRKKKDTVSKEHREKPLKKEVLLKVRAKKILKDLETPNGFKCSHCDKHFDNKNKRYKHIMRFHAEGYPCSVCGKRYPFKTNLAKHERLHQGPMPREECPVCKKMVRVDLAKNHAFIHEQREKHACLECDKNFVSRASYENHLKYSQAHSTVDVLKYKCSLCDKGYRSKGELEDHTNYQHLGKTQHKCPICSKALATTRCITRHVRRVHEDIKEGPRDKVCQQCGKIFRDKKGLREHEFIHTGERPLSCEICGCTFRQSSSLYTHRKRVHNIYPDKKNVEFVED